MVEKEVGGEGGGDVEGCGGIGKGSGGRMEMDGAVSAGEEVGVKERA